MDVRDGWATEYARKAFSVTMDDGDVERWLAEQGLYLENPKNLVLPKVWHRVMRLLAYLESAVALSEWGDHEQDEGLVKSARADADAYQKELGNWAAALRQKFLPGE